MNYKGGNVTLNSGGIGPDEYMFRCLPEGQWHRVYIRTKYGRAIYQWDKSALSFLLRHRTERLCVSDCQQVWHRLQQSEKGKRIPLADYALLTAADEFNMIDHREVG